MSGPNDLSRRHFLAGSAATAAALLSPAGVFAQGSNTIKVGVIGCGGRGSGAAVDAANADPGVVIWAMGDLFPDRLASSREALRKNLNDRYQVPDGRAFTGWRAYEGVLGSGVDYVILATPPGFRPMHLKAAIDARKHVFMEKPVATDAPGIREVFAASDRAKERGLNIVAGTQRRHDFAYREAMKRIHEGQMGDVVACYAYWNQGALWSVPKSASMTDMEWQLRNWLYFAWLSGDHIVEQHVHNLDVCNWAMGKHPAKAVSLAGRQVRTEPVFGHIFDHFATEYEYDNGVKLVSMCRQIDNTAGRVSEHLVGTKGTSNGNTYIRGEKAWRWEGDRPNPYMLEHRNLVEAIRGRGYINEGRQVAESTLTAIMGRMAAYTGAEISWDQALESQEKLIPETLGFGPLEVPPVAMPGKTKFV